MSLFIDSMIVLDVYRFKWIVSRRIPPIDHKKSDVCSLFLIFIFFKWREDKKTETNINQTTLRRIFPRLTRWKSRLKEDGNACWEASRGGSFCYMMAAKVDNFMNFLGMIGESPIQRGARVLFLEFPSKPSSNVLCWMNGWNSYLRGFWFGSRRPKDNHGWSEISNQVWQWEICLCPSFESEVLRFFFRETPLKNIYIWITS